MFEELYQEVIMDHASRPRNTGRLEDADAEVEADNPLCGDELTLTVHADSDGRIDDILFDGSGCAICTASASMMTVACKGLEMDRAADLSGQFHTMLTSREEEPDLCPGQLQVLAGVRKFPMRIKCATLAWHALNEALDQIRNGRSEKKSRVRVDEG